MYPQNQPQHSKVVVGYYAQWAIYSRNHNVFNIEADKLTHLLYAFYDAKYDAATQNAYIESLDTWADYNHNEGGLFTWGHEGVKGNIGHLKILKESYPHLKVIISVGGWTKSQNFPAIAASPIARERFAQSMVDFMNLYPWIDGFDIDWEFPITGGTDGREWIGSNQIPAQPHTNDDHKNFVNLLKEMRERFDANGMQDKEVAISMGNNVLNAANQFIGPGNMAEHGMTENIMDFCNFVSFFGYDFGGNWYDETCYNAPLFGGDNVNDPLHNPTGRNQVLSELVDVYLTDVGIPANKLVMGLPFYGKIFEGVATTGTVPSLPGLYESAPRTPSINIMTHLPQPPLGTWDDVAGQNSGSIEFCDLSQGTATNPHHYLDPTNPQNVNAAAAAAGWVRYWDDTAKVPYLYNATENRFISYDDAQSIDLKVKYAISQQLAGVMIWELSQDARNTDQGLLDVVDSSLVNTNYSITLNFSDTNNSPLQGLSVELADDAGTVLETLTTDANGQVIFIDQSAFQPYVISYSDNTLSFLPSSVVYNGLQFDSDKTVNVVGSSDIYQIQGSVKENSQLLTDVDVVLKDATNQELERVSSTDGNFQMSNIIGGQDYTLIAEKDYYSFTTLTYTNLSADQTNQEIVGTRDLHSISGNVHASGVGIQGVSISVVGNNQTYTATTDTNGDYTINNLPAGYSYVITPSYSNTVFNPSNFNIPLLDANNNVNFEENVGLIYGEVKDGSTPVSGAVVTLVLPWTNGNPYTTIQKTTNSQGEYFYTETDFVGYDLISSLKLETWDNGNVTYYPNDLVNIAITSVPQEYNFNSAEVIPEVTINEPNQSNLNVTYGSSVDLEAAVSLSFDDGGTTISSVNFMINSASITHSNSGDIYTGSWTPTDVDYGNTHTFTVEAESTNGETATAHFDFTLNCTGTGCPNVAPQIVWDLPNNTTINQNLGFQNIPIQVTVTDQDGTVSSVNISIDGSTSSMASGANDTYTYDFTPSNYQQYPVVITATDNDNDSSTFSTTLTISNSQFVPLPSGHIILGFAHSWENAQAPYIYFEDMAATNYNVVIYSFIETSGNYYTPVLTVNSSDQEYLTNGVYDPQKLRDDIQTLRDQGIPVLVSIGGQNGHVELNNESEKDIFVQGVIDIINLYGFDGIDVDLEGGSMNFGAGSLTDFSYASVSAYPKLKYMIDAIREIVDHFGEGFHLTSAPETQYVQGGYQIYADSWGSFLPVIHNLRDDLDLLMVQLYNSGTVNGLDGQAYTSATPDFLTAMSDMLITGFEVGSTGINFPGLPASKIMIGIPSCPSAAGSGYIVPSEAIKALNYLKFGTDFSGRSYTLDGGEHPNLRGVMTWSINWDAASACASEYEFSDAYYNYFNSLSISDEEIIDGIQIFPNPTHDILTITTQHSFELSSVGVWDISGKNVHQVHLNTNTIDLSHLKSGLYLLEIKSNEKKFYKKIIVN